MVGSLQALLMVYGRPGKGMSAVLDEGGVWFGAIALTLCSAVFPSPYHRQMGAGIFMPLLLIGGAYVPAALLAMFLFRRGRSLSNVFYSEYTPLLACSLIGATAAAVPATLIATILRPYALAIAAAACLYFAFLMVFALRAVFGAGFGAATSGALLALGGPIGAIASYPLLGPAVSWLLSPFFLFYAYRYFQGDLSALGGGLRSRQSFRRQLEAATINPNDAEAQFQLGLLYLQRRQLNDAKERFERAAKIDRTDAGPPYQLGLIAREEGRHSDSLKHFQEAARLDPKHSSFEVLRDLGEAYRVAARLNDAKTTLEMYIDRRPYDAEGLFYLGQACEAVADITKARDCFERSIEAARTAPHFRRHELRKWARAAETRLKQTNARTA